MYTNDFAFTQLNTSLEVLHRISPAKLAGVEKLAQMYIKLLLTQRGSCLDDPDYGTDLVSIIGSTTDKEGNIVKSRVIEAVGQANKWFKAMQMDNSVDDNEMLKDVRIMGVSYDAEAGKANLKLLLSNNKGRSVAFGLIL